jgi:hypothetical protein
MRPRGQIGDYIRLDFGSPNTKYSLLDKISE